MWKRRFIRGDAGDGFLRDGRKQPGGGCLIELCWDGIKPGSLHCASRHVRSEANVGKKRRLAAVGVTKYFCFLV